MTDQSTLVNEIKIGTMKYAQLIRTRTAIANQIKALERRSLGKVAFKVKKDKVTLTPMQIKSAQAAAAGVNPVLGELLDRVSAARNAVQKEL